MGGDPIQPLLFTPYSPGSSLDANEPSAYVLAVSLLRLYTQLGARSFLTFLLTPIVYTQPVPIPSACLLLTEELFSSCCSKTCPWPAQSPLLVSTSRIIRDGGRFGHSKAKYPWRWAVHQGSYHQGKLVWCSHKIYFCQSPMNEENNKLPCIVLANSKIRFGLYYQRSQLDLTMWIIPATLSHQINNNFECLLKFALFLFIQVSCISL